jgi:inosine-uridine nucleoside N-ribohydrolase
MGPAPVDQPPVKLILDVDTGTDDAVALMLAALHPALDLVGATAVNGNVPVHMTTENTLRVFDHIGHRVPVYRGMAAPLVRPDFPVPRDKPVPGTTRVHGDYLDIPPATSVPAAGSAVEFLIETYRNATEPIILVPTGPLTNIAAALKLEPRLVELIPEIILMGGAHYCGNITPTAEFNIWADPEAAKVVFTCGIPRLTIVPLDATHRALLSLADCDALDALGTPAATACATFTRRRIIGYDRDQPMERPGTAPVHDALCVAAIIDRSVITTQRVHADVEVLGELTVGQTVFDVAARGGQPPNADVAFDADERAFVQLLLDTFAPEPAAAVRGG